MFKKLVSVIVSVSLCFAGALNAVALDSVNPGVELDGKKYGGNNEKCIIKFGC